MHRTGCDFCCISDSSSPFPKYLLVSITSANSTYSSLSSFPLLWVGRFFNPWLCIFWFVSTCETKFWKSVGFLCKGWLSAGVVGDLGPHIQQSYFLLPLSNKSLSLYSCILNFVLPTVSLFQISPGRRSTVSCLCWQSCDECIFPVRQGLVTDNLCLLDQPITVQTRKVPCPLVWRRSSLVHDTWKWRAENRKSDISLEVLEAAADSWFNRHVGCCGPAFSTGIQHLWSLLYCSCAAGQLLLRVVLFNSVRVLEKH